MRVLVVDDSGTARRILKSVLPKPLLADLVEAKGGQEAIDICRAQKIDLMFLDLTMPEVDGFGVLAALADLVAEIPIIVVSADVQPLAQERVKALGARAFIKKTPSTAALEVTLAELGIRTDAA
jgi:two-component system chemotaxis response regulator CheY